MNSHSSLRKLFGWCLLALAAAAAQLAQAGEVTLRSLKSKALNADYRFTIYLPDGYESGRLRYPVLYLLHGNGGDENEWLVKGQVQPTADTLIREGRVQPLIIVMPSGGTTWWVDGNQDMAETALIKELIPHIDASYRTINARDGRMIGGLSAGGYGSVNAVFKYPELFVAAAALSPAVYVPTPPSHSSGMRVPPFQKDGKFDQASWERLNYGLFQKLFEYQPKLVEYRVIDGDHEWPVWRDTIGDAIKYMSGFASRPQGAKP